MADTVVSDVVLDENLAEGPVEEPAPEKTVNDKQGAESSRLKICNFPKFAKYPQVKTFLDKKLKVVPGVAYFSLGSPEEAAQAFQLLNGKEFKGTCLLVKRVADEPEFKPKPKPENERLRTAAEITTPLAGQPYEAQLSAKQEEAKKTVQSLVRQLKDAKAANARYLRPDALLQPILRSPVLTNYRNKCEFTVGRDAEGNVCVGFVSGSMANREVVVVAPTDTVILTDNTQLVVNKFTEFVRQSGLEPFDEFKREGFWKMLTVRDFVGDCMLIFTAHPLEDAQKLADTKRALADLFVSELADELGSRVTSVYWQQLQNASDPALYEHLAGVPYVYESILGVRFRISPATFFQTNSRGAEVLYTEIGDALKLPGTKAQEVEDGQPAATDPADPAEPAKPLVVLDICCGAGTIGQCLLRRLERSVQGNGRYVCVGVELVEQAVSDAQANAIENGFKTENCRYLRGQAEIIFPALQNYLPKGVSLEESRLVGVLDPPRAGISSKVIISCRRLTPLRDLVYVSCDPRAALKNLVDLCRPESKKYEGDPFRVQSIRPVDLFPQTSHYEWVILLSR